MNRLDRIIEKIEKIEKILAKIKDELEILRKESQSQLEKKKTQIKEPLPTKEELQREYEKLYEEFITKNSESAIIEFIKGKSKPYLKAFCEANSLPIYTTKISKDKIAEKVIQCMIQRKFITKKAKE